MRVLLSGGGGLGNRIIPTGVLGASHNGAGVAMGSWWVGMTIRILTWLVLCILHRALTFVCDTIERWVGK